MERQAKNGKLNGGLPEPAPIADRLARMTADPSIGIIGAGGGQEKSGGPVLVSAKVLKRALELVSRQSDEAPRRPAGTVWQPASCRCLHVGRLPGALELMAP